MKDQELNFRHFKTFQSPPYRQRDTQEWDSWMKPMVCSINMSILRVQKIVKALTLGEVIK